MNWYDNHINYSSPVEAGGHQLIIIVICGQMPAIPDSNVVTQMPTGM